MSVVCRTVEKGPAGEVTVQQTVAFLVKKRMRALQTDLQEKSMLMQVDKSRNNQLWEADRALLYILSKIPSQL